MSYGILYSEQSRTDLIEIYEYIAFQLMEPRIAAEMYESITSSIRSLKDFPLRNALIDYEPWHSKGLRKMPVKNYLVFYTVDDTRNMIHIIRIMYGARNIERQLSENETTDRE